MLRRLLILLALFLTPAAVQARGIEPQLVAEGPGPAGGEVELAIDMRTQPGWHGYWLNPGDAGLPMAVKWELPPGYSVGPLRYPVPTRLTVADIMNYVYERDYAVLVRLKVPKDAKGAVRISASANWLACTDKICVPESGTMAVDVTVGNGLPVARQQFDEWRRALPRPLATQARFEIAADKLRVALPLPRDVAVEEPYLFPSADGAVDYAAPQHFRRLDDLLIAELPRRAAEPSEFAGVLSYGEGKGLEFHAVKGAVPTGGKAIGETGSNALLWAVLGALAGGLLLNLMPCVFPILALKALHLAKSGGDEREARRDALAYTLGAVVGTGALGVALLAIRAAGAEAGWAFQLQDPRTVTLLLLLAVAITANLAGLFELPVLSGRMQPAAGFATGALAAFVATPCAGPFLGAALGTALLLPIYGAVLVFAALGLGLALPFLIVAFVPQLRQRLPKPGAWMRKLQRFLAIPMGLTALACLWLLYRQLGLNGLAMGGALVASLILYLWVVGTQQWWGEKVRWPLFGALVVGAGVLLWQLPASGTISAKPSNSLAIEWSDQEVARTLKEGRPAFVYFTADWCLTCKVNEAAAIDRDDVRTAFVSNGVEVFEGDWTNGDPEITRFLESRGRAGVPLYLWYEPGKEPEELPQVLTPSMLTDRARRPRR